MSTYLDTCVLLAYYRQETCSERVQKTLMSLAEKPTISSLTKVEFSPALSRWVRTRELSKTEAQTIDQQFASHIDRALYLTSLVQEQHYQQAENWLRLYSTNLRTLDALQLAVSYKSGLQLITCDKALYQSAAKLEVPAMLVQ